MARERLIEVTSLHTGIGFEFINKCLIGNPFQVTLRIYSPTILFK